MVPLKFLSIFLRSLEMPLTNCETNLISTWSDKCVISNDTKATPFAIPGIERYVRVVTLSTQDNAKLLQQLKLSFKRTFNWDKYQSKITIQGPNTYLDDLIDPNFQGVNILGIFLFGNAKERILQTISSNGENKGL